MEKETRVPIDVVEEIFLRLPAKSNIRFKTVSKKWRSIIVSLRFTEKHLSFVAQSKIDHQKILLISLTKYKPLLSSCEYRYRTMCLESTSLEVFSLPLVECSRLSGFCDGLFCIYDKEETSIYLVNPTTKRFRQLPQTIIDFKRVPFLAFAKATLCGYKLVWLYHSDKSKLDPMNPNQGLTKCEVFDFRVNAWRYLTSTPSYPIFGKQMPVSANGSVYWLTERYNGETKVIVFDLETESFRLLPKTPVASSQPRVIDLCVLDNRLCVSKRKCNAMIQEIWSLQSSSEDRWVKIYTKDLSRSSSGPCTPLAICKNKEILLRNNFDDDLLKYDPKNKSFSKFHQEVSIRSAVPYFQSLISLF